MTATDRGPVIGTLLDPGGLAMLHGDDLRILARSLRLFASSLARRDGAVPANVLVLLSTIERAVASATTTARLPSPAVLGRLGSPGREDSATVHIMEIREVAVALGCGDRNVRDLAARGALPGEKRGGRWTFAPLDVAELLDTRRSA